MAETTSGERENEIEAARASRIASARSDFVSSLGRRAQELRSSLHALEQDLGSGRLRDDLKRRVHALSAGARLLRFSGMATALADVERVLERAAAVGGPGSDDVRAIAQTIDALPSLVWNEPTHEMRATERPPSSSAFGKTNTVPPTVLVVGPVGLADAITHSIDHTADGDIECERTDVPSTALDLARVLAPDVAVIDADLAGAKDLVEKLTQDALTEAMPLIVVGSFNSLEESAKWVAGGAARVMAKPLSPQELRKACVDLGLRGASPAHYVPLGQITVDELTARIIEEVKRGLPEALVQGKSASVPLGDGSDVLAAVWGAVARIRDLVMIKTAGAVRFSNLGPEGAMPIAPWWGESPTGAQRLGETRSESETPLDGRRVVVADDDPAVTWFIGGVLRTAGADVREAHDGERALELCFRSSPDLVISDVLMPGLDGFALCRALKRDIALCDVPVILLSWKEDLLQRLRDLGADADGYLRKEASAAAILQRVYEVLRPRTRIEARLSGEGEVRGRLDGLTPRTLLEISARSRPDARVCVRDASFLYEVELRDGSPKSATRTTSDGSFQRGKEVFGALLGVRAGRFVVSRASGVARGTLLGSLENQLREPLAHARAALHLLSGTRLLEVHRVNIALDRVIAYLSATPEPSRSLVTRLADGASPRGLILGGEVAPVQLEDVLADLATHGAIVGVRGAGSSDLLGPALEQQLSSLRRGNSPSNRPEKEVKLVVVDRSGNKSPLPPVAAREIPRPAAIPREPSEVPADAREAPVAAREREAPVAAREAPVAARETPVATREAPVAAREAPTLERPVGAVSAAPIVPVGGPASDTVEAQPASLGRIKLVPKSVDPVAPKGASASLTATLSGLARPEPVHTRPEPVPTRSDPAQSDDEDEDSPSSLEAAVIRQLSEHTPAPLAVSPVSASSIVDASALRTRSLASPPRPTDPPSALPSLPPDAIVPEAESAPKLRAAPVVPTAVAAAAVAPTAVAAAPVAATPIAPVAQSHATSGFAPTEPAAATPVPVAEVAEENSEPARQSVAKDTDSLAPRPSQAPRRTNLLPAALAAGTVMALLGLGLRFGRDRLDEGRGAPSASPTPERTTSVASASPSDPPPTTIASPNASGASTGVSSELARAPSASASGLLRAPVASAPATAASAPAALGGVNPDVAPSSSAALAAVPADSNAQDAGANSTTGEDLPLPVGAVVPSGQGLLDIESGARESIFVDGVELGRGPFLRLTLSPGVHEVRVRLRADDRVRFVVIRAARRTRLSLTTPWTR